LRLLWAVSSIQAMKDRQTHRENDSDSIGETPVVLSGDIPLCYASTNETQRFAALLETSRELAGKRELKELLEALASRAREFVHSDGVTLYLVEEELLRPIVSLEEYSEEVLSTPLQLGQGISGGVAVSGKAEIVNRVDLTGRGFLIPGTPLEPESLLCTPLKYEHEVIGVLTLNRLGEWEFELEDLEFVNGLANLGAAAIYNGRLYERLAKSERNYRTLFNSIGEAIFVCAPETQRILDISDSAVRRYGYSREELLTMTIFDLHPVEEQQSIRQRVAVGVKQSTARYDSVHHRKKDGTIMEVNISAVDIEFQGCPARLALAVDVTEQQRVRRELEQAQKLESVGLLASGIAHNLNGPLSNIQGLAELLRALYPETTELQAILRQIRKIKDIIRTLMLKVRHQEETRARRVQLNELLKTELAFLEANLFFKHEVEKIYSFDPELPEVWGVYGDFSQALLNIVNNAIDAMYSTPQKILQIRTKHDDGRVVVEIEDTGPGMTPEIMTRVFEPFFTTKPPADSKQADGPTGTGLGLSASRELLARYDGRIEISSEPNQGSIFTISIPAFAPESHEIAQEDCTIA
jgi:PAS domain S-box-containing protein